MATRRRPCLPVFPAGLPAIFPNSIPCVMSPLLDSKLSRPVLLERWTGASRRNDPPIRKVRGSGVGLGTSGSCRNYQPPEAAPYNWE
jgi:hypothetical protein